MQSAVIQSRVYHSANFGVSALGMKQGWNWRDISQRADECGDVARHRPSAKPTMDKGLHRANAEARNYAVSTDAIRRESDV